MKEKWVENKKISKYAALTVYQALYQVSSYK